MKRLTPYTDESFAAMHAAGSMTLTASQIPALFGASRWCSRYALAAHLAGKAPLAEPDHGRIELGKRLERVAIEILDEHLAAEPPVHGGLLQAEQVRAYAEHDFLPLIASPDAILRRFTHEPDGIAEIKVVSPLVYKRDWTAGPPLAVELQHQTQFACTGAADGRIVALVIGDFSFFCDVHETKPHARAIARIEREAQAFMAALQRDEMPEPDDDHDATARALEAIFAPDETVTVMLAEAEAAERLERWRQAQLDRLAAEKIEEAQKRWFLARIADAGRVLVGNSGEIVRKRVSVKASVRAACTQTRWSFKDHAQEEEAA